MKFNVIGFKKNIFIIIIGVLLLLSLMVITSNPLRGEDMDDMKKNYEEGQSFLKQGEWEKALSRFQKALEIYEKLGLKEQKGLILIRIGQCYGMGNQWDKALEFYESSLIAYRDVRDKKGEGIILERMGIIYFGLGQYEKSLEYFGEGLKTVEEMGDQQAQGEILGYMGKIYQALSKYPKALEYNEKALRLHRQRGDKKEEGTILSNMGMVYQSLARYDKAMEYYEQALSLQKSQGDKRGEGTTLGNTGTLYQSLSQYDKAMEYYEKGLKMAKETKNRLGEGIMLGNMGDIYRFRSRYEKALEYYDKALTIIQDMGDKEKEAELLSCIASVYNSLSQYQKSLELYERALKINKEMGNRREEAECLMNIGVVYQDLSQYTRAMEYYKKGLEINRDIGNKMEEISCLGNMGAVYHKVSQYQKALEYCRQAYELAKSVGDKRREGIWLGNMGSEYLALSQPEKALECYKESLKIARETGSPQSEAVRLENMGMVYHSTNKYSESIKYYDMALKIMREIGFKKGEPRLLENTGWAYRDMGDRKNALIYFKKAVDVIEEIRGEIRMGELKQDIYQGKTGLFEALIELLIDEGDIEGAFIYAEKAKSRVFLDMIGNKQIRVKNNENKQLALHEQKLLDEIRDLDKKVSVPQGDISKITLNLRKKREEYRDAVNQIRLSNPQYAGMITVDVKGISQIQNHLSHDEMIVEYFVGENSVHVWTISVKEFQYHVIPVRKSDLNRKISSLRNNLIPDPVILLSHNPSLIKEHREKLKPRLREMYDMLVLPLKENIKDKKHLIIIPHGNLHFIPFCALVNQEDKYLIENYTVLMDPSASSLVIFREKNYSPPHKFSGFAYGNLQVSPTPQLAQAKVGALRGELLPQELKNRGIPPLPGTEEEVKKIEKFFIQKGIPTVTYYQNGFTRYVLQKEIPDSGYIHMATHGFLAGDKKTAEFSGFMCADDFLYISDIMNWELNCRLVVLSACQTGLGMISEGDDMVGLSRAFMYAGTDNLIVTLWSVSDESTRDLMIEMYREMLEGKSVSDSLRLAQLSLLNGEKYFHPYYWSPFVLYGR